MCVLRTRHTEPDEGVQRCGDQRQQFGEYRLGDGRMSCGAQHGPQHHAAVVDAAEYQLVHARDRQLSNRRRVLVTDSAVSDDRQRGQPLPE